MNEEILLSAAVGGALIGIAAVWLYLSLGRIAGISGILGRVVVTPFGAGWPWAFVGGLAIGAVVARIWVAPVAAVPDDVGMILLALGGVIVGIGTRMGSGCTSGHGVCGNARLSPRSMVATLTFVGVGMLAGTVIH